MKRLTSISLVASAMGLAFAHDASAAPTLRFQIDQRGDFLVVGNTLGHDCGNGTPAPVVGTVGACGNQLGDTAPDIFWRSESPGAGQAAANNTITAPNARSTALLTVPAGAVVTNAFLYWASRGNAADPTVTLSRPGGGFTASVDAISTFTATAGGDPAWQSVADITAIILAQGSGAYNVADVTLAPVVNTDEDVNFGAWSIVVLYEDINEPLRNLAVFDGLDVVSSGNPQNVTLDGFRVPNAGFDGKLGVITYEGDGSINGDQFLFEGVVLSNAGNPANNFFNSSRTLLGAAVSTVGDLPQLTGGTGSMSGFDLDVVDVTAQLTAGQTSADLTASSTQDRYYLGAFITSISTFAPDFTTSQKTALDVNGPPLVAGDIVEFSIVVENTGNDDAIDVTMTDALPAGLTFIPGTLRVDGGPILTEAPGDDTFDYDAGTDTLVVRVGVGADAVDGGLVVQGDSTTVTFRVTIDSGVSGILENQARITAQGLLGAPVDEWPTGSTDGPGTPTPVPIDECLTSADCPAGEPICDTASDPNRCVACLDDGDCGGLQPSCDVATGTCTCIPSGGAEICDGDDNDCNGTVDEGNPGGGAVCATGLPGICGTGVGACQGGAITCIPDVTPGSQLDVCEDGIDQDCDGAADQDCGDSDGDGLIDQVEVGIGTDPNDADSDDDGVSDGAEPSLDQDSDGDGLINALDPDSDDDGLPDGTELGLDCSGADTDVGAGNCTADGDDGATVTDPLDADTDDGGVTDGAEDSNLNGVVDGGETDPTTGNGDDDDDNLDDDGDGLSNVEEETLGTDPNDADSDDDGVVDGLERNPSGDTDGDGLINALDPDSDDDGLFDGTEMGFDCDGPDTDAGAGNCRADADGGATTTSPVDADTDDGGVRDGSEDSNLNGAIDGGELDPNDPSDDDSVLDDDGDGLSNQLEGLLDSDPNDADTDDDGASDGVEANPSDDTDGDGTNNILDPDSDGDGLTDGTELGFDCEGPDTDEGAGFCTADGDSGATTTSMVDPDTDGGGVSDGDEDANHDGVIDAGETDPNDGTDDVDCEQDSDCGGLNSGRVCTDVGTCVDGCRGEDGNGCPDGEVCTSIDTSIGECVPDGAGGGGAGPGSTGSTTTATTATTGSGSTTGTGSTGSGDGGSANAGAGSGGDDLDDIVASGNGLLCAATPQRSGSSGAPWLLAAIAAIGLARRRSRTA